jgi:hypothetical protein
MTKEETKKERNPTQEELLKMGLPYYDETKHWVKFLFLEQPGQRLDFSYGRTVYEPSNHNNRKTVVENFHLQDGEVYELPQYIIEHLNSLMVPDPKKEVMPNGQVRVDTNRKRNRVSCAIVSPPLEKPKI